jgi:hypothetical protein
MWKWLTGPGLITLQRAADDHAVTVRQTKVVSGKYALLHKYLANRYADVIVLTFGQIEDVLGSALPELARTYHAWWTKGETDVGGPPHADAWTMAGRTATPNLRAQTVTFERIATARPGLQ